MNELEHEPRSWWSKNWKWVVPVGGCFTIIVLGILLLGTAIFGFFSSVKSSTGADEILIMAQNNPRVIELLGEPIEKDGFGNYSIKINNGEKTSEVSLPIKGPKSEATLKVKSSGSDYNRVYEVFEIYIEETGELIDLKDSLE
ncbi:cytochrome c oxidase assembly factor Coa1 family protein [Leeuwenhoekiella parthenopeia]|uniref:Cytochrome c oxidase assembly factor 1 family protein n=1 Tax=Leeuwenhoekiella parthenopeia TaxID=2890320 RepID=A0ABS8GP19_9FLAO|nr:cytochrome c oxidase assembly factor Coa1 family protein [Leeuwenhoekiella parthenopeia]MCC4211739.1 cytochrome c oxidase assembly factor 1 family protein [Leeuwenhoekiella parthenopeia]